MNNKYFKILAGILLLLIVLEWISGIRASVQLDKATASAPNKPMVSNKPSMPHAKKEKTPKALKVHLFGEYIPDDVGASGVKRSALNISVVGILFDADEKQSHVMLELSEHQVKVFGVGDTLPGGAVIKRITPEGVLLQHQGVLESLSLPKNELRFSPLPEVLKQN